VNGLSGDATVVAAWIGSTNAGDELVHLGLRRLLEARSVAVQAVSLDPAATRARYGGRAATRARLLRGIAMARVTEPLLLGGGGLLQDETSAANLPYHLMPLVAARARGLVVAGIGLGAGPLRSRAARRFVSACLSGIDLAVRDHQSADLLASLRMPRPAVTADLALALPDPPVTGITDVVAVSLRPWDGRHRLPAQLRSSRAGPDPRQVAHLAGVVDAVARRLELPVRFVAFDSARDDALHHAVAGRVRADVVDVLAPDPVGAMHAVAGSRAALAMRYHAGVAALLGRTPAVMLAYDPKVDALVADVGGGFTSVALGAPADAVAEAAARAVTGAADGVLAAALDRLRSRGRGNELVLDRLLESGRGGRGHRPLRFGDE
jgi:polysaccharide pyruvyl transferase CsaB